MIFLVRHLLLLCFVISYPSSGETVTTTTTTNKNTDHQRRQISSSTLDFTANVVYNKLYQRSLNIHHARVMRTEPKAKLWFAIENGTIFAVPLFGDSSGPFLIEFQPSSLNSSSDITPRIDLTLNFNFTASSSLFYPSNHLLLALFNISSTNYNHSLLNRYFVVRTLSLALNLSESLLTIHKINGSMVKVYFSCDLYLSSNLTYQLNTLIDHYYSRRLQLLPLFTLPLIEISIVRVQKQSTTPTTSSTIVPLIEVKKAEVTLRTRLLTDNSLQHNRTVTSLSNLLVLKQFYQPLVLVPLAIIAIGLFLCAVIACCLCCNRRPSSSSTLLLPTGETSSSGSKHFYRNYPYRKHRQQYDLSKKKFHQNHHHDQRQFISKGIPVVFAEELDEKLEQTHTPLVMRIEKAPFNVEHQATGLEKTSL